MNCFVELYSNQTNTKPEGYRDDGRDGNYFAILPKESL